MGAAMSQADTITIVSVSITTFVAGMILSYVLFFHQETIIEIIGTKSQSSATTVYQDSADYMPSIVLSGLAICFTGGIGYVVANQVYSNDKAASKSGIQTAIGLAWALFVIAAVLIPTSLSSAKISADSKYYLLAAILTFFFSTIVAIIIFFNKLNNLPNSMDQIDFKSTQNLQMGLLAGTVAYGVAGITML
jgi:hypothetical protein